jgi:hypothetical protein
MDTDTKTTSANEEPRELVVQGAIEMTSSYLDGLRLSLSVSGLPVRLQAGDLEAIAEEVAREVAVRWNIRCDREGVV